MRRTKPDNALGQNLRRVRRAKGWSQREAAEKIGVSFPYLCQLEKGRTKAPTITVGLGLAKAYDLSIGQIAAWTEQPPQEQHTCPACGQPIEDDPNAD